MLARIVSVQSRRGDPRDGGLPHEDEKTRAGANESLLFSQFANIVEA
jgi:hypothetical protein